MARLSLLFGGKNRAPIDAAEVLRRTLHTKLPTTDPLRAARLQTHLFLGQMPAFPTPGDQPLPSTPPMSASNVPEDNLAALRAEKQSRATARAEATETAAQDPARKRVNSLRTRRRQELIARDRRALSTPTRMVKQSASRAVQAAAARTPARMALNQVAAGQGANIQARMGGRSSSNVGINGVLLLLLLITLALVIAGGFWGYNWYQNQTAGEPLAVDTPSTDLFDDNGNSLRPAVPTQQETPPAVPAELPQTDSDPLRVEQEIRETTILLLEQELNLQNFMPNAADVDGIYDVVTLGALREFANTIVDSELAEEILTARLHPSQEQLERWKSILDLMY